MDGADRWRMHIGIEPRQSFPDLRSAPTRLVLLQSDDLRLDLEGQLIGVAIRPARAVSEPVKADLVVAGEDLVASLPRDAELPAQPSHLIPVKQSSDEL